MGGFSGSWGESAPSVLRKRDMLVGEGVQFDPDGRVAKVSMHMFVAPAADATSSSAKRSAKRRDADNAADCRQPNKRQNS